MVSDSVRDLAKVAFGLFGPMICHIRGNQGARLAGNWQIRPQLRQLKLQERAVPPTAGMANVQSCSIRTTISSSLLMFPSLVVRNAVFSTPVITAACCSSVASRLAPDHSPAWTSKLPHPSTCQPRTQTAWSTRLIRF